MRSFDTLTEAMADLKSRGYDRDFNLRETFIECGQTGTKLSASDFEITEVYRFEGNTDPGDELVLYAIEAPVKGMKGTLVNAYGPYANTVSGELVAKLQINRTS
jgi:hypothetical protein